MSRSSFSASLMLALAVVLSMPFLSSERALADDEVAAEAETEANGEEHHETGAPLGVQTDLVLWSLVTFVLFLLVLKKLAWKPMIEGLDAREARIVHSIAAAEEAQRKAASSLAEYEARLKAADQKVGEMVAEAKRDAERTSQDIMAKARTEVEAMRDRAREDINQARDTALKEVFDAMSGNVREATEHVLGRALNDGDQERLIDEALSQLSA